MTDDMRWVLLAEDDENIRSMIRASLETVDHGLNLQIVEARDGLEAITMANHREFHCVITDLKMPRSNGEDFIRSMQTHALNANTPTLVITGNSDGQFSERFSHIRVFPKPFSVQDLARTVVQEIKLGRMDSRIAVHLMNPFVHAIKTFIEDEVGLDLKLEDAAIKKAAEGLIGDFHCTMTIMSSNIKNRFSISFDREILDHLKTHYFQKRAPQWAGLTPDLTARQVCQALFEAVAPNLKNQMGGIPRLAATSIITNKNESEYSELIRAAGVTLVGRTDYGRVIAGAFSKPKPPIKT